MKILGVFASPRKNKSNTLGLLKEVFSAVEVGLHLKILAKISHLVKDKFVVERLRKIKNKHEILPIIFDFERYFK